MVPTQKFYSNQFANAVPGEIVRVGNPGADITASVTLSLTAAYDFRFDDIADVFLSAENTGADGTDPLSATLDVQINGVSIFDTLPSISKAAADGANTLAAGTGVVVGVIDTAANAGVKGDLIAVIITLTRTTPEDEMVLQGVVKIPMLADYDSDMTVQRLA